MRPAVQQVLQIEEQRPFVTPRGCPSGLARPAGRCFHPGWPARRPRHRAYLARWSCLRPLGSRECENPKGYGVLYLALVSLVPISRSGELGRPHDSGIENSLSVHQRPDRLPNGSRSRRADGVRAGRRSDAGLTSLAMGSRGLPGSPPLPPAAVLTLSEGGTWRAVHEPGNRSLTVAARNRALGGGPPGLLPRANKARRLGLIAPPTR